MPRALQKVCGGGWVVGGGGGGGGWWWLRVTLVLSFGLSQAEQYLRDTYFLLTIEKI